MVDPARVRAKLAQLERFRARLGELRAAGGEVWADRALEGRYLVQASAQICIDLANHLIASEGWAPAEEYRQVFVRLGEHDVLPAPLVGRMQDLAGLRNRLVHLYDEVDDDLVRQALDQGLDDLDDFAAAIARRV